MKLSLLCFVLMVLAGCSSPSTETPKPAAAVKHPAPTDESRKMPIENRVSSNIVEDHMLDRQWLPGGTLAHYKNGAREWDLVLLRANSPAAAAHWLLDYKKELDGAKVIPSFGGFFGSDKGRPVFMFTKGSWLAGVIGLPESEADAVARVFASRIS